MNSLATEEKEDVHRQVQRYLLQSFEAGDLLPNERELSSKLNISRYSAAKALNEMALRGVVSRERGRGSYLTMGRGSENGGPKTSRTVMLLVADEFDSFLTFHLLKGAEKSLREQGFDLAMRGFHGEIALEQANLAELENGTFAGAIVTPYENPRINAQLTRLVQKGCPLVLIDRHPPDFKGCWVEIDHEAAAFEATQYLVRKGHKRIAHLTLGDFHRRETESISARENGFRRAMAEAGLSVPEGYIQAQSLEQRQGGDIRYAVYSGMHRLLMQAEKPTAVVLLNDAFAPGAMEATINHGLSVPGDISFIGIDDDPLVRDLPVSLTTMAQPVEQIAEVAVQLLARLIRKEQAEPTGMRFPARLVERASVREMPSEK